MNFLEDKKIITENQIQESLEWWVIQDLREYLNVEGIWECKVCGKRYEHFEYNENGENGQSLIDKHIKENHQDIIEKLKPEVKLRVIEQENRQREKWAEEDRLEAYRKAHHQCPCEKVIDGIKSAGWMTLVIGTIVVGGTIAATKYAIKEITKEVRK